MQNFAQISSAMLEKIRKSKTVVISGDEIPYTEELADYKKSALLYGKSYIRGLYVNEDTGEAICVVSSGLKELLRHDTAKDRVQAQSIAAIPELIRNAIYVYKETNESPIVNPFILEYRYYLCGLQIGHADYTVKMVIAVDKDNNRYYDHKLTQIEKGKLMDMVAVAELTDSQRQILLEIEDKRLLDILKKIKG